MWTQFAVIDNGLGEPYRVWCSPEDDRLAFDKGEQKVLWNIKEKQPTAYDGGYYSLPGLLQMKGLKAQDLKLL